MRITRRHLLANLPVGTAAIAAPLIIRAQTKGVPSSARDRLEEALRRIADPAGEGVRACLTVYPEVARAAADVADARARAGISLGPLDGAIVTIKDLFDVKGEPTRAGSRVLADAPTATDDALIVRRLRAAGAVIVAKTGMVEFAFVWWRAQPTLRHARQPSHWSPDPGWLVFRRRCRRCRWYVRDRNWHRHGRLCSHARRVLRRSGFQAEQAPDTDRGRVSALVHARLCRSTGQERERLRARRCHPRGR